MAPHMRRAAYGGGFHGGGPADLNLTDFMWWVVPLEPGRCRIELVGHPTLLKLLENQLQDRGIRGALRHGNALWLQRAGTMYQFVRRAARHRPEVVEAFAEYLAAWSGAARRRKVTPEAQTARETAVRHVLALVRVI